MPTQTETITSYYEKSRMKSDESFVRFVKMSLRMGWLHGSGAHYVQRLNILCRGPDRWFTGYRRSVRLCLRAVYHSASPLAPCSSLQGFINSKQNLAEDPKLRRSRRSRLPCVLHSWPVGVSSKALGARGGQARGQTVRYPSPRPPQRWAMTTRAHAIFE